MAYLGPVVRQRANLRVLAETQAKRLIFEGTRVTGVEAESAGRAETFRARHVIVAAGALHTPALLMRSGVGPGEHLCEMGVPVVADVPGIGRNLCNHPFVAISAYLTPEARLDRALSRYLQLGMRISSGLEGCSPRRPLRLGRRQVVLACRRPAPRRPANRRQQGLFPGPGEPGVQPIGAPSPPSSSTSFPMSAIARA